MLDATHVFSPAQHQESTSTTLHSTTPAQHQTACLMSRAQGAICYSCAFFNVSTLPWHKQWLHARPGTGKASNCSMSTAAWCQRVCSTLMPNANTRMWLTTAAAVTGGKVLHGTHTQLQLLGPRVYVQPHCCEPVRQVCCYDSLEQRLPAEPCTTNSIMHVAHHTA